MKTQTEFEIRFETWFEIRFDTKTRDCMKTQTGFKIRFETLFETSFDSETKDCMKAQTVSETSLGGWFKKFETCIETWPEIQTGFKTWFEILLKPLDLLRDMLDTSMSPKTSITCTEM